MAVDPTGITPSACARLDRNVLENPSRQPGDSRGLMNMMLTFKLADNFSDVILFAYSEISFWFYIVLLPPCRRPCRVRESPLTLS